jgi:glyoxylase-like metal-dependent hydrolase (beta-lactamase superfamily II)
MLIKSFTLGPFQVNNYIIACEETKKAALIDAAGEDLFKIEDFLTGNNLKLEFILITHGHLDHVAGADEIQRKFKVPVYINNEDEFLLNLLEEQLSMYGMLPAKPPKEILDLNDGDIINLGNIEIKVITTPGHSPGGVCFYIPELKKIFTGDTLFEQSVGRTDLPGGNYQQLIQSIKEKLLVLPFDIEVFSGHGSGTTIGEEKLDNPFVGVQSHHLDKSL